MSSTPETAPDATADTTEASRPARVGVDPTTLRRAPRLGRFVFAGVLIGALIALAASFVPGVVAASDLFWLVFFSTGLAGAILGALAYWILDRRSMRRTHPNRK